MENIFPKQKNDNKDGQRGDFYQVLVAIKFMLEDVGNSYNNLIIEHQGDVTFDNKLQIEVKHHAPKNTLGDNHIDFWKTLFNWANDKNNYERLILFTTSSFPNKGISYLKTWNLQTADHRYQSILKIIDSNTSKNVAVYMEYFKTLDIDKLKSLISKVVIENNKPIDDDLIIQLSDYPPIKALAYKKEDRITIIKDRIAGYVKSKVAGNKRWEISNEQFYNTIRTIGHDFLNENYRPIFDQFMKKEIHDYEIEKHVEKKFAIELKEICCDETDIREAINDYWKTTTLLIEENENDPFFNDNEFLPYKKEKVYPKLKIQRGIHQRKPQKNSYLFYLDCKNIDLTGYKGIPDLFFFMHGTMQMIVEDHENDFTWIL